MKTMALCSLWRGRLPSIVAGVPDPGDLAAGTLDAVVHLVEVRLRAEAGGELHLARAADEGVRSLTATMSGPEQEHLACALLTTLTPAAGASCACCKVQDATLQPRSHS